MKKLMKSVLACLLAFAMVLSVMPVNSYAAAKKSVVVTNQKQLEKALKNGATNIVIKTNKNVKITIPATKKAAKASISIQAKNATITNKASVKSIVIKDAKAFVESGKNNDIKITDSKLSLTVAKGSKGADIKVAKKDAEIKVVAKGDVASVTVAKTADVTLTVNKTATVASVNVAAKGASVDLNAKGTVSDVKVSEKAADTKLNINASGKVENVQIDAKADVAVAGSTTEAVKVTVNAKDTTIKAETAVDTTLNADTKLDLSKGAEGSTVTTKENVKADVANNTTDTVTVKDSTGKESTVDAGKTETKTDEGKKDEDKKDDQKTDDNSGNVTPTPTPTPTPDPFEMDRAIVASPTEVRVYFTETVPEEITNNQVKVYNNQNQLVSFEKVERDDVDTNAYTISFSEDVLTGGTYVVEITISGNQYKCSFSFEDEAWAALDKALEVVNDEFAKTHKVSVSGMQSPELCRVAFEKDFFKALDAKEGTGNIGADVQTRPFDYDGDDVEENHVRVSIFVHLYYGDGDAEYMCNDFVDFECSLDPVSVVKPEVIGATKNSIVINPVEGQQYACVADGVDVNSEDVNWWTFNWKDIDYIGNVELGNLDPEVTYTVYTKIEGKDVVAADQKVTPSDKQDYFVKFVDEDPSINGTVSYDESDDSLKLSVPLNIGERVNVYGIDYNVWTWDLRCNFPEDWEDICWDTTDVNGNLIFNGIEELSADNYTFTFNCMIYDSNDENAKVIGSQTFTVNFTVTAEDLNQIKASQTSED